VEIARLPGRRFCRASELREGAALDEGRIKSLTGDDVLMARHLYAAPFEFRPQVKLWLASNKLPRVDDRSHAFWRRAKVIPFRRTFDGSARDSALLARLRAEGPGILAWIVEGALAWQREGLPDVAAVTSARDDWRASQDVIAQWAGFALQPADASRTKAAVLYRAFTAWATTEGLSDREPDLGRLASGCAITSPATRVGLATRTAFGLWRVRRV
jgi:putative DNA primase/helicase